MPPVPAAPPEPLLPPELMLASGQDAETHRLPEQQPSLQEFPAQQMSPRLPHRAQMPSELLLVHALPA